MACTEFGGSSNCADVIGAASDATVAFIVVSVSGIAFSDVAEAEEGGGGGGGYPSWGGREIWAAFGHARNFSFASRNFA